MSVLTAFNEHFTEFVNDIHRVFPEDNDILFAKNAFSAIRRVNPRMIIKIWNSYIANKYHEQIEAGNIDFFIGKDYSQDLVNADNSSRITDAIDRLRNPIKSMNSEDQAKTMKYIQNLSNLARLYENTLTKKQGKIVI
jgi:hypothetical protein